ncbi:MAG: hypothetical protein ACRD9L_16240, partial [Bryobacteraceae bacterium]
MADGNPFQDPLRFERRVPPCAVAIFGANGDPTKRKLLPALHRLAHEQPESRRLRRDRQFTHRDVRRSIPEDGPFEEDLWAAFARSLLHRRGFKRSETVSDPVYEAILP